MALASNAASASPFLFSLTRSRIIDPAVKLASLRNDQLGLGKHVAHFEALGIPYMAVMRFFQHHAARETCFTPCVAMQHHPQTSLLQAGRHHRRRGAVRGTDQGTTSDGQNRACERSRRKTQRSYTVALCLDRDL